MRLTAARALIRIGSATTVAGPAATVPVLIKVLRDPEDEVRLAAAITLGKIGSNASAAIPALIEALDDPENEVRLAAAEAIHRIESGFSSDSVEVVPLDRS